MIKRLIGWAAVAASLAVIVWCVLARDRYRSMCFGDPAACATSALHPTEPTLPVPATDAPAADTLSVAGQLPTAPADTTLRTHGPADSTSAPAL